MMRVPRDPRYFQIATLGLLFLWGLAGLDLEVRADIAAAIGLSALLTQLVATRLARLPRFDPKSAAISALSLCLLLRTNHLWLAVLATVLTIGSKFLIRIDDRHVFNPTNFGIGMTLAATGAIWVSPGQWGTEALFAFALACLGGLVIYRAERSDVTYAFLGFYALIVVVRSLWLGDPLTIPLHQLENGAFLLFAFFMISDPKTTPDSRAGRILFALTVAMGAAFVQFVLFRTNGLLWSLLLASPTTPIWNRLFPGGRYQWNGAPVVKEPVPIVERSFA
jgi:enediyne biosynthesis protein E5